MSAPPINRARVTGSPVSQASGETLDYALDAAPYLEDGESIASPTAELLCLSTGQLDPEGLLGSPTIAGTTVVQTVIDLIARRTYLLRLGCTTNTGRTWLLELELWCYT